MYVKYKEKIAEMVNIDWAFMSTLQKLIESLDRDQAIELVNSRLAAGVDYCVENMKVALSQ